MRWLLLVVFVLVFMHYVSHAGGQGFHSMFEEDDYEICLTDPMRTVSGACKHEMYFKIGKSSVTYQKKDNTSLFWANDNYTETFLDFYDQCNEEEAYGDCAEENEFKGFINCMSDKILTLERSELRDILRSYVDCMFDILHAETEPDEEQHRNNGSGRARRLV
ncbi:uncharacterized protein LOC135399320 [Ornithodoros turicata]|uniref:uncharacterized protein LOC135399320 n=1 Tax=Ornithodoros turicata TaxID=34597 RepID=UPI0031386FB9